MVIKAVTIIQPWASLITLGEKQIETRSWPANYKGPLAIHAGKKIDLEACRNPRIKALLEKHGITIPERLPTGCVLSNCKLIECVQMQSGNNKHCVEVPGYKLSDQEYELGYYSPGRWGWILANIVKPPRPIPARGMQRLWNFDTAKAKFYGQEWD